MEKTISDLILSHCSIFENWAKNGGIKSASAYQLDFLSFYVDECKILLYWSPYDYDILRDNPNRMITDYENVYKFIDGNMVMYQYVIPWQAPVSVLQWYKMHQNWKERWRICIYGKALKLYYSWHLGWLRDYVIRYAWECCRADLCRDFKEKLNPWIIDGLKCSLTVPDDENRTYKLFWQKKSPCIARIYNKTLDLKRDKNQFAFLYPSRYKEECWRLEFQFTWNYSRSVSAIDRLDWQERNMTISSVENAPRNNLKTIIYSAISEIRWSSHYWEGEKILVLQNVEELTKKTLKAIIKKKN